MHFASAPVIGLIARSVPEIHASHCIAAADFLMSMVFGSSVLFPPSGYLPDTSNAAHNDINGSFVAPGALFALAIGCSQ
jgi:hypothetical protein